MSPWLCHNSWFLSTIRKRGICLITRPMSEQMAPQPTITNTSHHHQRFQVQTAHSDHARNVINSLCRGKLIISSGCERTHGFGFWPRCLKRGPSRGARGLVGCHLRAPDGTREPWFKTIWPLSPRSPIAPALVMQRRTQNLALSSLLWPAWPCPVGWSWAPGAHPAPPAAQLSSQFRMSLWKLILR